MTSQRIEPKQVALLVMMAMLAVAPMLFRGIPGGNDAVQHYEFAQQIVDSIRNGNAFPSFAGNSNHGFGDVGLRVYPPLAYYVLAGSYLIAGEWYFASIFAFFLIFLVGAFGVYLWAIEFFPGHTGLAAAGVFTFSPFHLNEIYNNFLYAEFAAEAILPFCFLFVTRTLKSGRLVDTLGLGVAFALLVGTHLPLTVIGSISLAVYALASLRKTNYRRIANLAGAMALGLVLSSFYWVRMITEMNWVKHSQPEYYAKIWSFQENFLISVRTFTDFMNDGLSLWFGDLILIATLVLSIPSLVFVARATGRTRELFPLGFLFAIGVFMATPLSLPIWEIANVLQRTQFPWRWLTVVTLAGSVVAGAAMVEAHKFLKGSHNKLAIPIAAAALLPFVFLSAFVVRAPNFTQRPEFNERSAGLSEGETFEGWWPVWAKRQAFSNRQKVTVENRAVMIDRWEPTYRSFRIDAGAAQQATISTFYYPHWKASVEGRQVELDQNSDGVITLQLPTNEVAVEMRFTEPSVVSISKVSASVGWLSVFVFVLFNYIGRQKSYGDYS